MKDFFYLLVISFSLQSIGWYSLRKGIEKTESLKFLKEIQIGMSALIWGLAIQLIFLIILLYSFYIVEVPKII